MKTIHEARQALSDSLNGMTAIDDYLSSVMARRQEAPDWSQSDPGSLSAIGHLIALDVPALVELVKTLKSGLLELAKQELAQ